MGYVQFDDDGEPIQVYTVFVMDTAHGYRSNTEFSPSLQTDSLDIAEWYANRLNKGYDIRPIKALIGNQWKPISGQTYYATKVEAQQSNWKRYDK